MIKYISIYVKRYLDVFSFYTQFRFNNIVIRNVSCSVLLHIKLNMKNIKGNKYRVEPESIKSNDNDILNWPSIVASVTPSF